MIPKQSLVGCHLCNYLDTVCCRGAGGGIHGGLHHALPDEEAESKEDCEIEHLQLLASHLLTSDIKCLPLETKHGPEFHRPAPSPGSRRCSEIKMWS